MLVVLRLARTKPLNPQASLKRPLTTSAPLLDTYERKPRVPTPTPQQLSAVAKTIHKAMPRANAARAELNEVARGWGYGPDDVTHCLKYVREQAPLIINFPAEAASAMARSTRYKTLFETQASWSEAVEERTRWSANLFPGVYTPATPPSKRESYLSVNAAKWRLGVPSFGDCMFLLSDELRPYITVTPGDSAYCEQSDVGALMGPIEHVLLALEREHLKRIFAASRGEPHTVGETTRNFLEGQAHCEINWATGVQAVVAQRDEYLDHLSGVKQLTSEHAIPLLWQGPVVSSANRRSDMLKLVDSQGWSVSAWATHAGHDYFTFQPSRSDLSVTHLWRETAQSESADVLSSLGAQGAKIVGHTFVQDGRLLLLVQMPGGKPTPLTYKTFHADTVDATLRCNREGWRVGALSWHPEGGWSVLASRPAKANSLVQQRHVSIGVKNLEEREFSSWHDAGGVASAAEFAAALYHTADETPAAAIAINDKGSYEFIRDSDSDK